MKEVCPKNQTIIGGAACTLPKSHMRELHFQLKVKEPDVGGLTVHWWLACTRYLIYQPSSMLVVHKVCVLCFFVS
jgi:hypothetical protein